MSRPNINTAKLVLAVTVLRGTFSFQDEAPQSSLQGQATICIGRPPSMMFAPLVAT